MDGAVNPLDDRVFLLGLTLVCTSNGMSQLRIVLGQSVNANLPGASALGILGGFLLSSPDNAERPFFLSFSGRDGPVVANDAVL